MGSEGCSVTPWIGGSQRGGRLRSRASACRFEPAPWFTLQRQTLGRQVTSESLAAVLKRLGNAETFP